tara:strand:- start:751 stop:936 length:186 start_codon:yes stop_codon:yes gene_type:complete
MPEEMTEEMSEVEKTHTLTSKEIRVVLSVIDVVSSRGGFKPSEFKLVGELFEKLNSFLKED